MVMVATHLTAVVSTKGGKLESVEERKKDCGSVDECREGIHNFALYFWHTEGWSVRNEDLMKAV